MKMLARLTSGLEGALDRDPVASAAAP